MKRSWFVLLFGLFILTLSVPAFAVIDNTHHELATYLSTTTNRYTCFACHGYPQPAGSGTYPALGRVGQFCLLRCHLGTNSALGTGGAAIVAGNIARITGTPTDNGLTLALGAASGQQALENGHGLWWGYFASGQADAGSAAPAWPYNDKAGPGEMECTTCHDVHNNQYAPFLRAPLSAQATDNEHAAIGTTGSMADLATLFCQRCHTGGANGANRYNSITQIPNGTHPVEMTAAGAPWAGAKLATWTAVAPFSATRGGRTISLKGTNLFNTPTVWGTGLNGVAGTSWNLGGKLGGTGSAQVVGCYTCHAVHMNKLAAAPTGQTYAALTVMPYADNSAHTATNDDLCVGCHGPTTQLANPGTTAYYHPVSNETDNTVTGGGVGTDTASYTGSTGTVEIVVNMLGKVYGAQGRLLCTSCHAPAHAKFGGAHAGSMIIATNLPQGCANCHTSGGGGLDFNQPNSHHVYGTTTNYTSATPSYANPAYMTGTAATLADGLQCWDCHTNQSTTAHNWQ